MMQVQVPLLGQINFQRAGEVLADDGQAVTDGTTDSGKIVFRTQPNGGALSISDAN